MFLTDLLNECLTRSRSDRRKRFTACVRTDVLEVRNLLTAPTTIAALQPDVDLNGVQELIGDLDGDGLVLTQDGNLVTLVLLNASDDVLVSLRSPGSIATAAQIRSNLESRRAKLDVDNDGETRTQDGNLIALVKLNTSDSVLTSLRGPANAPDTRFTAPEIKSFVGNLESPLVSTAQPNPLDTFLLDPNALQLNGVDIHGFNPVSAPIQVALSGDQFQQDLNAVEIRINDVLVIESKLSISPEAITATSALVEGKNEIEFTAVNQIVYKQRPSDANLYGGRSRMHPVKCWFPVLRGGLHGLGRTLR